jgi:hypothetical protein
MHAVVFFSEDDRVRFHPTNAIPVAFEGSTERTRMASYSPNHFDINGIPGPPNILLLSFHEHVSRSVP